MDALLRQEILELAELLKEELPELRNQLTLAGLKIEQLALISFVEDEIGGQFGCIITSDKKLYEFDWNAETKMAMVCTDITSDKQKQEEHPQIAVALQMFDKGELF